MIDRAKFFAGIRQGPFPGKLAKSQVSGIDAILDEWERRKLRDLRWLAYMLATVFWECDRTMQPITEKDNAKRTYLRSKKYWPWIGRGFVQLTWLRNYRLMTTLLQAAGFDVDLTKTPERALELPISSFVMFEGMTRGTFTGKKLINYFNDDKTDWVNARRIINGTDKAVEIAGIAKQFHADLVLAAA